MQSVSSAFEEMAEGSIRFPSQETKVSWDRATSGGDFVYDDESNYVMGLEYERELLEPTGSVVRAMADITLDNNSGRLSPGSDPDIGSYILPKRPVVIRAGFDIPELVQVFEGQIAEPPIVNTESKTAQLHCLDALDTIYNFKLQNTVLYQNKRTDEIIDEILTLAGIDSSDYDLDPGINTIAFAYFEKGDKLGPIIQKLCEAELARFYIDETGVYRFKNRQSLAEETSPVLVVNNSIVIKEEKLPTDKLVNVAEVVAKPRVVKANQFLWSTVQRVQIDPGDTITIWTQYDDPVAAVTEPTANNATSSFNANVSQDGTGLDLTDDISLDSWDDFATSSKGVFTNNGPSIVYLALQVWGQPARVVNDIFIRYEDETSTGIYGEQVQRIENNFIQSSSFAQSLAIILVEDRKNPGDYRELTILGNPALQLGDLIEWEGDNYNIVRIKTRLSASEGLVQTLTIAKRTLQTYFTIGVSTIGGPHVIAP